MTKNCFHAAPIHFNGTPVESMFSQLVNILPCHARNPSSPTYPSWVFKALSDPWTNHSKDCPMEQPRGLGEAKGKI